MFISSLLSSIPAEHLPHEGVLAFTMELIPQKNNNSNIDSTDTDSTDTDSTLYVVTARDVRGFNVDAPEAVASYAVYAAHNAMDIYHADHTSLFATAYVIINDDPETISHIRDILYTTLDVLSEQYENNQLPHTPILGVWHCPGLYTNAPLTCLFSAHSDFDTPDNVTHLGTITHTVDSAPANMTHVATTAWNTIAAISGSPFAPMPETTDKALTDALFAPLPGEQSAPISSENSETDNTKNTVSAHTVSTHTEKTDPTDPVTHPTYAYTTFIAWLHDVPHHVTDEMIMGLTAADNATNTATNTATEENAEAETPSPITCDLRRSDDRETIVSLLRAMYANTAGGSVLGHYKTENGNDAPIHDSFIDTILLLLALDNYVAPITPDNKDENAHETTRDNPSSLAYLYASVAAWCAGRATTQHDYHGSIRTTLYISALVALIVSKLITVTVPQARLDTYLRNLYDTTNPNAVTLDDLLHANIAHDILTHARITTKDPHACMDINDDVDILMEALMTIMYPMNKKNNAIAQQSPTPTFIPFFAHMVTQFPTMITSYPEYDPHTETVTVPMNDQAEFFAEKKRKPLTQHRSEIMGDLITLTLNKYVRHINS